MANKNRLNFKSFIIMLICIFFTLSCNDKKSSSSLLEDEASIRKLHSNYVQGWLEMDQDKIMALLEENSRIQPNSMKPIEGKNNIENFWFPKNNSKTVINDYKTEILSLKVMDTLAYTTHNSILDWSYQKDTINFSMLQKGINTTIYKKQIDGSWKIWRSMWTDFYSERK